MSLVWLRAAVRETAMAVGPPPWHRQAGACLSSMQWGAVVTTTDPTRIAAIAIYDQCGVSGSGPDSLAYLIVSRLTAAGALMPDEVTALREESEQRLDALIDVRRKRDTARASLAALIADIEALQTSQPHGGTCAGRHYPWMQPCDCWQSDVARILANHKGDQS